MIKDIELMEKLVSLCKRRGFIYQGSEIYGGLAGTWDYGPLGLALKKNIEKLFYIPLSDRRATTINHYEDLRIIDKLQKQGKKAIESNEYYNELVNYMQYPYINFKDFQKYGMNISPNRSFPRYCLAILRIKNTIEHAIRKLAAIKTRKSNPVSVNIDP